MVSTTPENTSDVSFVPASEKVADEILYVDKKSDMSLSKKKGKTDEELQKSFFNLMDPKKVIDNFEATHGPKIKRTKLAKTLKKSIVLRPETPKDEKLLHQMMNGDKYAITYWKDTWTALGEYRVFVIYTEMVDDEEKKPTSQDDE